GRLVAGVLGQLQQLIRRHAEVALQLARRLGRLDRDVLGIADVIALVLPVADKLLVDPLVPRRGRSRRGGRGRGWARRRWRRVRHLQSPARSAHAGRWPAGKYARASG